MTNPLPLKPLCIIPLIIAYTYLPAQQTHKGSPKKVGVDFDMGATMPTDKTVNDVFYAGLNLSLGIKWAVLKEKKLWIKPAGALKLYTKKAGTTDPITEAFRTIKGGVEFQYMAASSKKFFFYPLVRADYNWSSNYFSKEYNVTTTSRTIAVSDNFLKGTGMSFDAGLMVVRTPGVYLKVDYEYYKPSLKVHSDFIKEALNEGLIVPEKQVFNFSTVNIGLGITL